MYGPEQNRFMHSLITFTPHLHTFLSDRDVELAKTQGLNRYTALQCVAVCCSVLQCVAVAKGATSSSPKHNALIGIRCCSLLQSVAVHCSDQGCDSPKHKASVGMRWYCVVQCVAVTQSATSILPREHTPLFEYTPDPSSLLWSDPVGARRRRLKPSAAARPRHP